MKLQEIAQGIEKTGKKAINSVKNAGGDVIYYILDGDILAPIVVGALSVGLILGVGVLLNRAVNNKTIDKPGYHLISRSEGIVRHTRYFRYADGSQEVFSIHGFGPDNFYTDTNGDNLVDRIIIHDEAFLRETDYAQHKKEFDDADKELRSFAVQSK